MQYRSFGRLNWKPSALGFGAMRLPLRGQNPSEIDEEEATRMIRYAIDHGVNYVDTAYPYHDGASEALVGRALKDGYRERVHLATKLPCWMVKSVEDMDRYLNEQLERLQVTSLDFYLLHSLQKDHWHRMHELGVLQWAERAMANGYFRYLGFSFHDGFEVFREIVDAYDWAFCQIQYNYMDEENQAGLKGLHYAAARGLAVVVMEPIRGGQLAAAPAPVAALWDTASRKRAPAEWALQWIWNHPEVSVVLSGMSTMDQVVQNIASAERSGIGTLPADELQLVAQVRNAYRALCPIPCTACGYCQPCPNDVYIPALFETYNEGVMYESLENARQTYNWFNKGQRTNCLECGECEKKCPQGIPIMTWLKTVGQALGETKDKS